MNQVSSRVEKRDASVAAAVAAVAAFTERKRKTLRTLAAWSAILNSLDDDGMDPLFDEAQNDQRRVSNAPRPDYNDSPWSRMLRQSSLENHASRAARLFRRRFRIPYVFFKELVALVSHSGVFPGHFPHNHRRKASAAKSL